MICMFCISLQFQVKDCHGKRHVQQFRQTFLKKRVKTDHAYISRTVKIYDSIH